MSRMSPMALMTALLLIHLSFPVQGQSDASLKVEIIDQVYRECYLEIAKVEVSENDLAVTPVDYAELLMMLQID